MKKFIRGRPQTTLTRYWLFWPCTPLYLNSIFLDNLLPSAWEQSRWRPLRNNQHISRQKKWIEIWKMLFPRIVLHLNQVNWMLVSVSRLKSESSESVNFYRKIGHKAELRTTKALTSQLQWTPTKYVHPCYSNWKLPKATALWNRKSCPIFC